MTATTKDTKSWDNRTRRQKLTASITAIDQAMSFDPNEYRDAIVKHLWEKVGQLETRVIDLEGRDHRVA